MTRLPIVDFVKFIEQGYKEHWAYTMGTRCQNIQTGYLDLSKKERKNSSWARNGWFVTQYKDNAKQYKKALEDWDRGGRCSDCNGLAEGFYEIISGHRRKYAAQQLKYTKVPVIIRYMLEEDAIISMVDANLQRERISPSEKAFAYKMKYDVLKRKAGRRKCSQVDYLTGKKSVEVISEE